MWVRLNGWSQEKKLIWSWSSLICNSLKFQFKSSWGWTSSGLFFFFPKPSSLFNWKLGRKTQTNSMFSLANYLAIFTFTLNVNSFLWVPIVKDCEVFRIPWMMLVLHSKPSDKRCFNSIYVLNKKQRESWHDLAMLFLYHSFSLFFSSLNDLDNFSLHYHGSLRQYSIKKFDGGWTEKLKCHPGDREATQKNIILFSLCGNEIYTEVF